MKRYAYYGGSFDPPHLGHIAIARELLEMFALERFVFVPAFHAPHKPDSPPSPAIDRYTMLCLATQNDEAIAVSRMEMDLPGRPYTVETLGRLNEIHGGDTYFFVMGADSWNDIRTWREWEKVLTMTDHIVVTRPGHELELGHVTDEIRARIVDLRGSNAVPESSAGPAIYLTDAVKMDISATEIRRSAAAGENGWHRDVPAEVAKYIEKYQIYR